MMTRDNEDVAPYPCMHRRCTARFVDEVARSSHFHRFHQGSHMISFGCPSCSQRFETRAGLEAHKVACAALKADVARTLIHWA